MSTRITTAWRVTAGGFSGFLAEFRRACFRNARNRVRHFAAVTTARTVARQLRLARRQPWAARANDLDAVVRVRWAVAGAWAASRSMVRDPVLCVDCSCNVWFHAGRFYVIPYGEPWLWEPEAVIAAAPGVADFAYDTRCGPPAGVTARQWRHRGETWDAVCLGEPAAWDAGRLVHRVIDVARRVGVARLCYSVCPKEPAAVWAGIGPDDR